MGREERVEGLISTANPGSGVDNASSRVDGLTLGALVCGRLLLADDALLPVLQYNFSRVVDGAPQLSDSQCVPPVVSSSKKSQTNLPTLNFSDLYPNPRVHSSTHQHTETGLNHGDTIVITQKTAQLTITASI